MKPMDDDVIIVDNVKKHFRVYPDKSKTLKDKVLFHKRNYYEIREVLRGISLRVKRGEAIGLIGKNGCGKSTTLKLLTKILRPNEGEIRIRGRVSSLIELGAGFHPDLTGRENIYINASIFGIKAKEVDARLDTIIGFSELERYIDNPVRTYSSGMYTRLAFSVAINVDADVLLIDEILAVGDVSFQAKCFEKLKEIKKNGTTIVIVSHAMDQIEQICDRCIWLENGIIREEGPTRTVSEHYLASMEQARLEKLEREFQENKQKQADMAGKRDPSDPVKPGSVNPGPNSDLPVFCGRHAVRMGNREVEIIGLQILNEENQDTVIFHTGRKLEMRIRYRAQESGLEADCSADFVRDDGVHCYGSSTYRETGEWVRLEKEGELRFMVNALALLPGKYDLDIGISDRSHTVCDSIRKVRSIQITSERAKETGIVSQPHSWSSAEA